VDERTWLVVDGSTVLEVVGISASVEEVMTSSVVVDEIAGIMGHLSSTKRWTAAQASSSTLLVYKFEPPVPTSHSYQTLEPL